MTKQITIRLGKRDDVRSQAHMRAVIYEALGHVIPFYDDAEWEKIAQLIIDSAKKMPRDHSDKNVVNDDYKKEEPQ